MIFIPGNGAWQPQSATSHALNILATINQQINALGYPSLIADPNNAIWLLCLGAGTDIAQSDLSIVAGQASLNPAYADDNQISNLLPIAGTTYVPATFTTVTVRVTAGSGGTCTIPPGSILPFTNGITFITSNSVAVAIPASTYQDIICIASVIGPLNVPAGTLVAFSPPPANIGSVTNSAAAVSGRAAETAGGARSRILSGKTVGANEDIVAAALLTISGISQCAVYFNRSTGSNLTLPGGFTVAPRTMWLVIVGADPTGVAIAKTFTGVSIALTQGTQSQNFYSLSGQVIPINFDYGVTAPIYIKIFYDVAKPVNAGFALTIQNLVAAMSAPLSSAVTAEQVLNQLGATTVATIAGASVSTDNVTFSNKVSVNANAVPTFAVANIQVIGI